MGFEDKRKERIDLIYASIKKACEKGFTANKRMLINACMEDWGCAQSTIAEYINVLMLYGKIREVNGELDIVESDAEIVSWLRELKMKEVLIKEDMREAGI